MAELIDEVRAALPGVECKWYPACDSVVFELGDSKCFARRDGAKVDLSSAVGGSAFVTGRGPDFDRALKAMLREARDLRAALGRLTMDEYLAAVRVVPQDARHEP